jgi:hypothetical protein
MLVLRLVAMSKGAGRVQRQLLEIFAGNPDRYFSTKVLCRKIFHALRVEKKHRVSVLRALKGFSESQTLRVYRAVVTGSYDDLWYVRARKNSAENELLIKHGASKVVCAPVGDKRPHKRPRRSMRPL